jgi:hypothetical protein
MAGLRILAEGLIYINTIACGPRFCKARKVR